METRPSFSQRLGALVAKMNQKRQARRVRAAVAAAAAMAASGAIGLPGGTGLRIPRKKSQRQIRLARRRVHA